MRRIRSYHPKPIGQANEVVLSKRAQHHLQHVLRLQQGDAVCLFDGSGYEYDAILTTSGKRDWRVTIGARAWVRCESHLQLHLGQALLRGEKMDLVIQKAVELGVQQITPLLTEHNNITLTKERLAKRMQHWQQIIISACEQSGRVILPQINSPLAYSVWCQQVKAEQKYLLHPKVETILTTKNTSPMSIAIAIGPEGGFTTLEIEQGKRTGFQTMQLGPRILRTETAALAVLAILQYQCGDLREADNAKK